jgi:hypothetical protein
LSEGIRESIGDPKRLDACQRDGTKADVFKKYLASDYSGVYADGVKNLDKEMADMEKSELRDYSLTDMKVVFPSADVAVTTYKATLQGSSEGQDTSGTYNVASVWVKKGVK